ncbi:hypothetical protein QFC19_001423 [Naganishia cerealis]|uniref:Uncharacterized protein n=1 Tax=Naganishia cerealis TaxID=610337 RepID=A0ACC2WI82_9TREE|nr:hypothetical protein QFC19_001423 [Naganishia cerealis]
MSPATPQQFEEALDKVKMVADGHGKLREVLRRYHAVSPWEYGSDVTAWILARHDEIQAENARKRSRSVSQQPLSTSSATPLQTTSVPSATPSENAIEAGSPQVEHKPSKLDLQLSTAFRMSPVLTHSSPQGGIPAKESVQPAGKPVAVKLETNERPASPATTIQYSPGLSSPEDAPLSAPVKPLVAKQEPRTNLDLNTLSANGADLTQQSASPTTTSPFPRATSESSISSSVIRQTPARSSTPTPVFEQVADRERRLLGAAHQVYPSPPPSDDESFSVPVRQPFKPSANQAHIARRKDVRSLDSHAPDMEWTRNLSQIEATPPESPSAQSSSSSEVMLVDVPDDMGDDTFEPADDMGDIASPRPRQAGQTSLAADVVRPVNAIAKERQPLIGKRSTKEMESAKGKRLAAERTSEKGKGPVRRKAWEVREFVAPDVKDLRRMTLPNDGVEVIPFSDIQKLLPPDISGNDTKQLESSFSQLQKLLLPADSKRNQGSKVQLSLGQSIWLLNQIIEEGSSRYLKAFAADVSNIRMLEFFLDDAYSRRNTSRAPAGDRAKQLDKAKLTEWRAICVAYFTIKLLRKLNVSEEVLGRTRIMTRVGPWVRADDDIRKLVNEWQGNSKTRGPGIGLVPKRKSIGDDNDATNKRTRPLVGEGNKGTSTSESSSRPSTSARPNASSGRQSADDNAMSMFLAPAPLTRPSRPPPSKKTAASNDALAQAFASIRSAQPPSNEPEPARKSPDPSRPPRIGKDGKPRPHMSVRWKEGSNLEQIKFIERRTPTEVCIPSSDGTFTFRLINFLLILQHHDGSARQMEMDEEMTYNGTPDVQDISVVETVDQSNRERNIPAAIYNDERDIPPTPDEAGVQEAVVPADVAAIPSYEEEEQAYIPGYQYIQQQENQNRTYNQPTSGTPTAPAISGSSATGPAFNYGWGQPQQAYQAPLPNNIAVGNVQPGGFSFNVAALQQLQQQLAPVQTPASTQPFYAQPGAPAYTGYNNQAGYNMHTGYNAQPGFNPGNIANAPANTPNRRPGPPVHPDRQVGNFSPSE